jgi:eukaryotic-like serine/threonine-protein kinase
MNPVRSIGRYQIQSLIGTGAMGEVFCAHDPVIDRQVAIKFIRPELIGGSGSEQLLERFRREARAAGRRFHPNIVAIWDYGEENGVPFLVMELVDGRSLDEIIKASGRLEPSRAVGFMTQVLSALGFAHDSGIIHRDVKPSNIMVVESGHIKVADFGIAHIDASEFTIVGDLLGTPAYMAPEQLTGGSVDHRTDLFAVGVILFEMLTGVKPFRGKSITEIMSLIETRGPEDVLQLNPAVPVGLKQVIARSVAFEPADRFCDAAEFSMALTEAIAVVSGAPKAIATATAARGTSNADDRAIIGGTQAAAGDAPLPGELLRDMERDLATFIGPLASIALKRALRRTDDILALYEILGKHVSDPKDRAGFLARGRQRAAARLDRSRPAPSKPQDVTEPSIGRAAVVHNPASIVALEADLTRYIGPVARILVKRELGKFESLAKLCLVLAAHIPDERERKAFLNAHGGE